jgi:hypothetical protein
MDNEHKCGLRGCDGACRCGGYGYALPLNNMVSVCRCDTHLDAEIEALTWTCRTCGRDNIESACECELGHWGDESAPTRGFVGDAAW